MANPVLQIEGFKFNFLNESDAIYKIVKQTNNLFEKELSAEIAKSTGKIFVDVGAHFGCITLPASKKFEKVYSYEAHPENYKILLKNIIENKITNVHAINAAIGFDEKTKVIIDSTRPRPDNTGTRYFVPSTTGINVSRLDTLIPRKEWPLIGFIKIDVEEMEYEVLQGAAGILLENKPIVFAEEIRNDHPEKRKHNEANIENLMKSLGYKKSKFLCSGWLWVK